MVLGGFFWSSTLASSCSPLFIRLNRCRQQSDNKFADRIVLGRHYSSKRIVEQCFQRICLCLLRKRFDCVEP